MKPNPTALLIDGDKAVRRLVRLLLESHDYRVSESEDGLSGIAVAQATHPDVIIFEWALSDMDGIVVLRRLQETTPSALLVLSSPGSDRDAVSALDGGADDYVTKPFHEAELLARLRVLQRCLPGEPHEPILNKSRISVDLPRHRVEIDGQVVQLTRTEEALLHTFITHAGTVIAGKHLRRSLWGWDAGNHSDNLKVFLCSLRRKLHAATTAVAIETIGTFGYRLVADHLENSPHSTTEAAHSS